MCWGQQRQGEQVHREGSVASSSGESRGRTTEPGQQDKERKASMAISARGNSMLLTGMIRTMRTLVLVA